MSIKERIAREEAKLIQRVKGKKKHYKCHGCDSLLNIEFLHVSREEIVCPLCRKTSGKSQLVVAKKDKIVALKMKLKAMEEDFVEKNTLIKTYVESTSNHY